MSITKDAIRRHNAIVELATEMLTDAVCKATGDDSVRVVGEPARVVERPVTVADLIEWLQEQDQTAEVTAIATDGTKFYIQHLEFYCLAVVDGRLLMHAPMPPVVVTEDGWQYDFKPLDGPSDD